MRCRGLFRGVSKACISFQGPLRNIGLCRSSPSLDTLRVAYPEVFIRNLWTQFYCFLCPQTSCVYCISEWDRFHLSLI